MSTPTSAILSLGPSFNSIRSKLLSPGPSSELSLCTPVYLITAFPQRGHQQHQFLVVSVVLLTFTPNFKMVSWFTLLIGSDGQVWYFGTRAMLRRGGLLVRWVDEIFVGGSPGR